MEKLLNEVVFSWCFRSSCKYVFNDLVWIWNFINLVRFNFYMFRDIVMDYSVDKENWYIVFEINNE